MAAKQAANGAAAQMSPDGSSDDMTIKEEDEELAALGGKTRLISRKSPAYSSPSPQASSQQSSVSPVEAAAPLYVGPETPPSAVPSAASPVLPENVQWNGGYMAAPEVYGYTYPTQDMAEWQQQHQPQQSIHHHPQQQSPTQQVQPQLHHQHQHVHGHMQGLSVDMSQVQYGGYEHAGHPQMAAHPHHAQYVHSPIQQTHPMHASDPTTSWNYLFAQFNQV